MHAPLTVFFVILEVQYYLIVFEFSFDLKNSYGVYRRVYRREEKEFDRHRAVILEQYGLDVYLRPVDIVANEPPLSPDANGGYQTTGSAGEGAVSNETAAAAAAGVAERDVQQPLSLVLPNKNAFNFNASSDPFVSFNSSAPVDTSTTYPPSLPPDSKHPTLTAYDIEADPNKALCSAEVSTFPARAYSVRAVILPGFFILGCYKNLGVYTNM